MKGRVIFAGEAGGQALVSTAPISFFGGVDLERGVISDPDHPLFGQGLAGRVLVFPTGTGSTVGSFALLRLARQHNGPAALVMGECDTTVAVGAIIGEIPCVDQVDIGAIADGTQVTVRGGEVHLESQH